MKFVSFLHPKLAEFYAANLTALKQRQWNVLCAIGASAVTLGTHPFATAQTESTAPLTRSIGAKVKFDVDNQGRPTRVNLALPSGNADFDAAALEAVRKLQFKPADAGKSDISALIRVDFSGFSAYAYPEAISNAFIDGCTKSNANMRPFCNCALKEIKRRYSVDEFLSLSVKLMDKKTADPAVKELLPALFNYCASEVPLPTATPRPLKKS
jgi:TonB family protein